MTRALVALGLAASVVVLAGCGAAPPLPEPMTSQEIDQLLAEQRSNSWKSMFPNEPEPVVDVIAYIPLGSTDNPIGQCVADAHLDKVEVSVSGYSMSVSVGNPEVEDALNRQLFICSAQYPTDPATFYFLTREESLWLDEYNHERLVPCLQLMGYVINDTSGQYNPGQAGYWSPYFGMKPIPTEAEWQRIDLACPPAPVGPDHSEDRPSRG